MVRTEQEIADIYMRNRQYIYRICFIYMKNNAEAEDMLSETFFRLIDKSPCFHDDNHEKAWLIKTATNLCKNALKKKERLHEDIDDYSLLLADEKMNDDTTRNVFEAINNLPDMYKLVAILHYYDGYTSKEIAHMVKKPASTVRNYLKRSREMLKEAIDIGE